MKLKNIAGMATGSDNRCRLKSAKLLLIILL